MRTCCIAQETPLCCREETQHCKTTIPQLKKKTTLYRHAKAKRIQHHQTSSATNAKGTSLDGKETRKLKQPCTYIDCYIKTSQQGFPW